MEGSRFDRFSIVVFAPAVERASLEELRRDLPPHGRPTMEAHVTVKGTFVQPVDLDRIGEITRRACAEAAPFPLETADVEVFGGGGESATVVLLMKPSEPLRLLHERLVRELRDLCVTTYGSEAAGRFRPHLTLVQQIPASAVDTALASISRARPHYAFDATEVTLVGRGETTSWEPARVFLIGNT